MGALAVSLLRLETYLVGEYLRIVRFRRPIGHSSGCDAPGKHRDRPGGLRIRRMEARYCIGRRRSGYGVAFGLSRRAKQAGPNRLGL